MNDQSSVSLPPVSSELRISSRGKNMPDSPIRKLTPYAEKAAKRGIKIYHLNIGQPDIDTPKEALNAVKMAEIKVLPYTKSEGLDSLRFAAQKYYKTHQIDVDLEDIIVTTGASEGIFFLINSIADVGDEVITPEPFYANYLGFALAAEANIVSVEATLENNFSLPSISSFEEKITERTRAILICNPGNPTGNLYSKEDIKALGKLAIKHNIYLIIDEVYREFIYEQGHHYSVMEIKGIENHAIMIDSVSKRYNMCGARVGFIVTKNKMLRKTILKFAQARLCPPVYGQIAAESALKLNDTYVKNTILEYKNRRDILISKLSNIPGVKVSTPRGAFYCMAELPVEDSDDFCKWLLDRFQINGKTVMLAPASGFYYNKKRGKKQVRVAYVLQKEALIESVEIIAEGLKTYNKR